MTESTLTLLAEIMVLIMLKMIIDKTGIELIGKGKIELSSEEKTVIEHESQEPFVISGHINLKEMEDGDRIQITEKIKLIEEEEYSDYATETYEGKQTEPIIYIAEIPAIKGIKITIRQISGTPKPITWEAYKTKVSL